MKLENRVALVTGAGRGMGRAIALRLASLGADIVVADVRLDSAREYKEELTAATVMDEIKTLHRRSIGIEVDLTNKKAVDSMFKKILGEFGRIDILVNNVGGNHGKTGVLTSASYEVPEEDVRAVIDRNLMTTIFCCQAAIPSMIAQKSGTIVSMASRTGLAVTFGSEGSPYASTAYYGAAKAAVIHYTRALAAELGPYGIRVNCVAPGLTLTSEVSRRIKDGLSDYKKILKDVPLGRLGEPTDVVNTIEYLCTELSYYITGQCIRVDGGRSLF